MDDGIVTQSEVARSLPPGIRDDFLPPAEQEFEYVCSYHPGGGFLVPYAEIKRLERFA